MSAILEKSNPRGGARDARRAARSAPLPDSLRPVRPGMNGGAYKALTDADVVKIHNAALDALENIGLADAPESGIELMTKAGARLTDTGRRCWSAAGAGGLNVGLRLQWRAVARF